MASLDLELDELRHAPRGHSFYCEGSALKSDDAFGKICDAPLQPWRRCPRSTVYISTFRTLLALPEYYLAGANGHVPQFLVISPGNLPGVLRCCIPGNHPGGLQPQIWDWTPGAIGWIWGTEEPIACGEGDANNHERRTHETPDQIYCRRARDDLEHDSAVAKMGRGAAAQVLALAFKRTKITQLACSTPSQNTPSPPKKVPEAGPQSTQALIRRWRVQQRHPSRPTDTLPPPPPPPPPSPQALRANIMVLRGHQISSHSTGRYWAPAIVAVLDEVIESEETRMDLLIYGKDRFLKLKVHRAQIRIQFAARRLKTLF
ncbi:hypothetical protein K438DRAFT_1774356 [Mycena galopus ATCC 62051]|nr:hypothetical protein K438DRAFT_1774356 [Mycena galopus ATCC 62051]